jgi:hypothetical protein
MFLGPQTVHRAGVRSSADFLLRFSDNLDTEQESSMADADYFRKRLTEIRSGVRRVRRRKFFCKHGHGEMHPTRSGIRAARSANGCAHADDALHGGGDERDEACRSRLLQSVGAGVKPNRV